MGIVKNFTRRQLFMNCSLFGAPIYPVAKFESGISLAATLTCITNTFVIFNKKGYNKTGIFTNASQMYRSYFKFLDLIRGKEIVPGLLESPIVPPV